MTEWASAPGSEFFGSDEFLSVDLLRGYRKHWDFWRKDVKTHPIKLPKAIRTRAVMSVAAWEGWEIRCAEVIVPANDWITVAGVAQLASRDSSGANKFVWEEGDFDILTPDEAATALGFEPESPGKDPMT